MIDQTVIENFEKGSSLPEAHVGKFGQMVFAPIRNSQHRSCLSLLLLSAYLSSVFLRYPPHYLRCSRHDFVRIRHLQRPSKSQSVYRLYGDEAI